MSALDQKINEHFAGYVVRKDLVKAVKGNAIVPSYVLEYLLGQYCASDDEGTIQAGIETVKEILARHYVHRNEANLVRSNIRERGLYKVIDKISVVLNDKKDRYEASFSNLGIDGVLIDSGTIKKHQKLLVGGVWCIADVLYDHTDERDISPWNLSSLKPIQLSHFDFDTYVQARAQFTTDEWIDLLIQSIGYDPEMLTRRSKLLQLVRLIPFCERNYNLLELGPKGTGKSHIYSEFSPHGILVSGGEVTVAKLFVNNSTGRMGLVGYWDCVAFDEFAGKQKRVDKALVDIMKNYMANKSFSRGGDSLHAEASMALVGNTANTVPYMLKHEDLFSEIPALYRDSAFLDRLHFYIPGWEVDIIRSELFSDGYGFVVDYFAEVLRYLRNRDDSQVYQEHFSLSEKISTRDRDGVLKTFSGFMKLLFPGGGATREEVEELLNFSMEGRKRVKDQLMRIDSTYADVDFSYTDKTGQKHRVSTLEEEEYPEFYYQQPMSDEAEATADAGVVETPRVIPSLPPSTAQDVEPKEQHLSFKENRKGVSYDTLFGPYVKGAKEILIQDPYIRLFYQVRNLMEFLEVIASNKAPEDNVVVRLHTIEDEFKSDTQREFLVSIQQNAMSVGINFSWEFDETSTIHDRSIATDHGWKIILGRGLDIFQRYEMNDAFAFQNRLQKFRAVKAFEVTYIRVEAE